MACNPSGGNEVWDGRWSPSLDGCGCVCDWSARTKSGSLNHAGWAKARATWALRAVGTAPGWLHRAATTTRS
ncbi:unnamed protein product [Musa textilis]